MVAKNPQPWAVGKYVMSLTHALLSVPVPTNEVAGEAAVRDINDRPIFRAAVLAEADLLLSGDKDFLEAKIARPKVLSPADFVKGYGQA